MTRERIRMLVVWVFSVALLAFYFKLVLGQTPAPPEAPTNVQVAPAHLQITGMTGDQVIVQWADTDCPGMSYGMTNKAGTRGIIITCLP